jgi:hypothetical protein
MTRKFFALLSLIAFAGLSSCGGGGGGGGSSSSRPTLPSTASDITTANIPAFATSAALATRIGATTRLGPDLNITGTPGTVTDPGCVGLGGGPATLVLTPPSGSVSGTATFASFDRCYSLRLSGTSSVNGVMTSATKADVLTLTFTNLTYTPVGASASMLVSGTATIDWTSVPPAATYLMTINATVTDAGQTPLFKLDSFQIDSEIVAGQENIFISGRLTTPDGFVDITPGPARMVLPRPSAALASGSIIVTGSAHVATVQYHGTSAATATIAPK